MKVKEHPVSAAASKVDLSAILSNPFCQKEECVTFQPSKVYDFHLERTLDEKVLLKKLKSAVEEGKKASLDLKVKKYGPLFWYDSGCRDYPPSQRGTAGRHYHDSLYGSRRPKFRGLYPERTDADALRRYQRLLWKRAVGRQAGSVSSEKQGL